MNDLLNRIFGLSTGSAGDPAGDADLGFGDPGVTLEWARPLPAWAWALIVAAALLVAWLGYRRLAPARLPRVALTAIRATAIVLLAVLLAGPALTRQNERTEPDHLAVLIDRSQSLTIPDAPPAENAPRPAADRPGPDDRITRDDQLAALLDAARPTITAVADTKRLAWFGFDRAAFELAGDGDQVETGPRRDVPPLGQPAGPSTDLSRALTGTLERLAARPISGVLLFTDGRSQTPISRPALQELTRLGVPVFPVPLGSADPAGDLAIDRVDAPAAAFLGDAVPVRVRVSTRGDTAASVAAPPTVTIADAESGEVFAERPLTPEELEEGEARLTIRPEEEASAAGLRQLRVTLTPAAPDLLDRNNTAQTSITLGRGPVRVLYIDGGPRWEHRYLKNILLRERSIDAAVILYAVGRRYQQDGDITLPRLPTTPDEWADFDVIIMGDVRAGLFSPAQLQGLRDHVATRGAGVLWLAGPAHMPGAWHQTPAGVLLPITGLAETSLARRVSPTQPETWPESVTLARTPAADALGVIELAAPADPSALTADQGEFWNAPVSDPTAGWTLLRWAQRIEPDRLKPAAEVLALAQPASAAAPPTPLVLSMRFGSGRSVYVATDEIWRWRFGRGENLTERFWVPVIRLLARGGLTRAGRAARLIATPDEAAPGEPVLFRLELLDQSLIDARPARIAATIEPPAQTAPQTAAEPIRITLTPDAGPAAQDDPAARAAGITYSAVWTTAEPGRYRAAVDDPLLAAAGPTDQPAAASPLAVPVTIAAPGDELLNFETDHRALERLARETGGRVLDPTPAALADLPDLLPNRQRIVQAAPDVRTLWDTPPALVLLLALLTIEWVARRLIRLA